jgi:diguanylate cyclase (GGDEF)-like protein
VPWLLLAGMSLAGLVGIALMRRLQRTARRAQRAAHDLAASQDELEHLIAALDEGVARRDADGRVRLLNDSARRHVGTELTDFGPDELPWRLLDATGAELTPDAHPGHRAAHGEPVNGMTLGLEDPDGARRWLRFSACPLTGGGAPAPHPVVMSFTDVTAQRELELHLTRLAECDPLTGLANRRRFEEDLAAQLERCRHDGARAALVTLDIDRFKDINDSRGHLAGDEVLRATAAAVQGRLRAADVAGRLGGDEFAILLVDADAAQARETAADFVRRIREAVRSGLDGFEVTVTYGVAEIRGAATVAEVLDASDRDMYRHKPQRAAGGAGPVAAVASGEARRAGQGDGDLPQALSALYAAVRACDAYTASHSRDVVALARAVALRLGLDEAARTEVEHVALIHDIGKIAIPDSILRKPGGLSWEEEILMRQHPAIGAQIVGAIDSLSHLAPAVRAEHERWDGGGYPDGLAGARIPVASRIVLVCDAFHAMTSDRPYRASMDEASALAELQRHAGTQFCPEATGALLEVVADRRAEGLGALAPAGR